MRAENTELKARVKVCIAAVLYCNAYDNDRAAIPLREIESESESTIALYAFLCFS